MTLFRTIDSNSKGFINMIDLENWLADLGLNYKRDDLLEVIFRMSRNKSTRINYDEFKEEYGS